MNGTGSTATSQNTEQVEGPTGKYAGAVSFATADASISVETSDRMDAKYSLSVVLHVKLDAVSTVFKYSDGGVELDFDGTNLVFTVGDRNQTSSVTVQGSATAGAWNFVILIVDYNSNLVTLNVNGAETSGSFDVPQTVIDTQGNVVIGADGFNGEISCVQFYDFALLPDEFAALAECPTGVGMGNEGELNFCPHFSKTL